MYIVIHIFFNFILLLFSWTPEVGKGHLNPKNPTTGGFLILKLLLYTGGVTAKEHPASGIFFN
jgi:hypothetical protein